MEERELIANLKKKSKDVQLVSLYVNRFRELIENKQGEGLQSWIDEISDTNLKELIIGYHCRNKRALTSMEQWTG